jgi:Uma2 family endonuclease
MERKLREYFGAGVRLVWLIDTKTRSVDVFTSTTESRRVRNGQVLTGEPVLPGFKLSLRAFFARGSRRRKK